MLWRPWLLLKLSKTTAILVWTLFEADLTDGGVMASEGVTKGCGTDAGQGSRKPSLTCYPQPTLQAKDLLPRRAQRSISLIK